MALAPEVGRRMRVSRKAAVLLGLFLVYAGLSALPARAASYYVTVAGLGGEPDYEQRFTALAKDLDKLLKASSDDAHVYTLTGSDATKAHLTDTVNQIAREAKADDTFTLTLIGHGSFDSVEYKFNLPGPDISGEELASLCDRVPIKRQLIVNTSSASGGSIRPGFCRAPIEPPLALEVFTINCR